MSSLFAPKGNPLRRAPAPSPKFRLPRIPGQRPLGVCPSLPLTGKAPPGVAFVA